MITLGKISDIQEIHTSKEFILGVVVQMFSCHYRRGY